MALLSLFAGAWALRAQVLLVRERAHLRVVVQRETQTLTASRALADASRRSVQHVVRALERCVQAAEPRVDAMLVFRPEVDDLHCVYAGGARAQYYRELRMRRDAENAATSRNAKRLIPTDGASVSVALTSGDQLSAVVYVSSPSEDVDRETLVRVVEQAAVPLAIASEREADRATATFDGLTGLYTPRAFRDKLRDDIAGARANRNASFALWFIDTDHFKRVNDSLGHAAGDEVLQRMAMLLRAHTVATHDLVARNGGDEFCVVLRDVQKLAAIERAQAFCDAVRAHDFGPAKNVTVSIGVAAFPYDASDAAELLEAADAAMYHSKNAGRDRVSFCNPGGHAVFSPRREPAFSGAKAGSIAPEW